MTDEQTYAPYCLHCEKEGHRTRDCWSTHCVTARSTEINSLSALPTPAPTMVDQRGEQPKRSAHGARNPLREAAIIAIGALERIHHATVAERYDVAEALRDALAQTAPLRGEYPPLPDTDYRLYEAGARDGYGDAYDVDQLRAYVDADRATRPTLQSLGGDAGVSEAMVDAYLQANDAYWKRTDQLPTPPDKWRTGTPREATRESLRAALSLTSTEKSDGWLPIEQAPKDDSEFLIGKFDESGEFLQSISHHDNPSGPHPLRGWNHRNGPFRGTATHYHSLPAAPKAAEKSGRSE